MDDGVVISGPGDLRRPVILLVEDEVLVRLVTGEFLRDAGYNVLEAVNAKEALAIVATGHPLDLVITDIRMPGEMNGIALAATLKSVRSNLPIAILSSHPVEGVNHEADLFLTKPCRPRRLLESVQELIGINRLPSSFEPKASA